MDFAGVTMMAGDCRDPAILDRALKRQDLVVVSLTPGSFTEEAYRSTYVDVARTISESIGRQQVKPGYVLWVSSTSVYGEGAGEWVDETTPARPKGFSGQCLLQGEREIGVSAVASTVVRFSGIYGPGRNRMIEQVRAGYCAPAEPVQWSNRIHSEDCAGVLHHLAAMAMAGNSPAPLYIGTDCEPVPLHDVHQWLAARLGVTVTPSRDAGAARGNRRCCNRLLLDTGYRFRYPTFREGYAELLASTPCPPR